MHIFLTGDIRIGKSTVLKKALSELGLPFGGFETFYRGERGRAGSVLLMKKAGDAMDEGRVIARFEEGRMAAFPDRFDEIGCALLKEARKKARLILMDECGRLEKDALLFQREVLGTLDRGTPVLGVVRRHAGGWTERIVSHLGVLVLAVTEKNRDILPERIVWHVRNTD
jgi:nucleoside-triphosphatase